MDDEIECVELGSDVKHWYKNDKLHREDGPAVECANGNKFWYKNNEFHREDGPAVEWADGSNIWYLYGVRYSFSEWCDELNLSQEEKCELALIYG